MDELYRLQARCHEDQIELLHQQIKILETELHPYLIPNQDIQRMLWIPGNRYLKLAFSHAAVRAVQYYPEIKRRSAEPKPGRNLSRSPIRSLLWRLPVSSTTY